MVEQDAMMQGNGWRAARWLGAAALLAVPAVAMRFTAEVRWTAFDFAFFAGMLAVLVLGYELIARNGRGAYRIAGGVALAAAFLLVWINGAVGIIGDEGNRANLMYGAVLLVVAGGAMLTRLRAAGMARTMAVAAVLQVAIGIVAVIARLGTDGPIWPRDVIGLTGIFALLWLAAAALFRKAAQASARNVTAAS